MTLRQELHGHTRRTQLLILWWHFSNFWGDAYWKLLKLVSKKRATIFLQASLEKRITRTLEERDRLLKASVVK